MEAFCAMLGNLETTGLSAVATTAIGSATAMGSGSMTKGAFDASPWRLRIFSPLAVVVMAIDVA